MEDTNKNEGQETVEQRLEKLEQENQTLKNSVAWNEKWVQKIINEKKVSDKALAATKEVSKDNKKLLEIYENEPEVAQKLLDDVFDGISIEEYKESIGIKKDTKDVWTLVKQ